MLAQKSMQASILLEVYISERKQVFPWKFRNFVSHIGPAA